MGDILTFFLLLIFLIVGISGDAPAEVENRN
jgi:hypothetical protein